MKVDLYTQKGEKSGTLDLPAEIFEVPFNRDLVHQALVMQLASMRVATAHTKTKGEVRGGGRKPFRQKGTGRARQGSTRNPHMRGGGVTFGPSNERNFKKDMPKKQRRAALFCALSQKARDGQVFGLESYEVKEPKTKEFSALLGKLPVTRDVLVVIPEKDLTIQRAANNLPNVKTIQASYLNIRDLQRHEHVMLLKESVGKLKETFLK